MSAGYSGTPLWKKLGYGPGARIALVAAPVQVQDLLVDVPHALDCAAEPADADAIHCFVTTREELRAIAALARHLPPARMLWVSWPKLSSPLSRGLKEDDIRAAALPLGLVDIKVCALDADWSGLKLVRRKGA